MAELLGGIKQTTLIKYENEKDNTRGQHRAHQRFLALACLFWAQGPKQFTIEVTGQP